MQRTANLNLPLLLQNQLNKEVVINEALFILDTLLNCSTKTLEQQSTLPQNLEEGEVILTPNSELAFYKNGWYKIKLKAGLRLWVQEEGCAYTYNGAEWQKNGTNGDDVIESLTKRIAALEEKLKRGNYGEILTHNGSEFEGSSVVSGTRAMGINTTADPANNRLAVVSNSNLFASETGNVRLNLNKKTSADTSSFLFQTNWSGRAEFGLTGGEDFTLKVSPDGAKWIEVFKVNRATGVVDFKVDVAKNGVKIF